MRINTSKVPRCITVSLVSLRANGSSKITDTTELTLTFSAAIPGLSVTDITVTGATKGTLSGTGPVYTLTVSDIARQGDIVTVAVANPDGYSVTPAERTVIVHKESQGTLTITTSLIIAKIGKTQMIPYSWDGAAGALIFACSNPALCAVYQDGTMIPLKAGTVFITVTPPDGPAHLITVMISA